MHSIEDRVSREDNCNGNCFDRRQAKSARMTRRSRRRSSSPRRSAPFSNGTTSIFTARWRSIIGATFFSQYPEATRNIFALLAFAAGFLVRPFGALVFGRIGDLVGRKYTFLVTILIMGSSTFLVGLLSRFRYHGASRPRSS